MGIDALLEQVARKLSVDFAVIRVVVWQRSGRARREKKTPPSSSSA